MFSLGTKYKMECDKILELCQKCKQFCSMYNVHTKVLDIFGCNKKLELFLRLVSLKIGCILMIWNCKNLIKNFSVIVDFNIMYVFSIYQCQTLKIFSFILTVKT